MAKKKIQTNEFFDINKFPSEKDLLLFGLSMNKLDYGNYSAKHFIEYLKYFSPSKITKPLIGANFIYSDFLYLYSDKPAPELKKVLQHQL